MYSMDFKTKIFDACQAGESCRQVSIRFAVSCTFVARMMKRYRETGSFVVLEKGKRGPRFRLSQKQLDRLGKIVEEKPGLNARQFRDKLGVKVSILTVWRALRRMGLTVKKTVFPAEQKRPDVAKARKAWHRLIARKQPKRLIVLDESGFTTNMYTSRGYAPKGQRLTVYEPHGHRHTSTLVGALTTEGFIAPLVIKGALNANIFENYITKILAKEIRPGDLLIMDNLSSHKTAIVRNAMEENGIDYQYLPPYSPDFSPIENAFSKVKNGMRNLAKRTFTTLCRGLGTVLKSITQSDARNYFKACGYTNP